jgi:uncharacterized protein (DUF2235 family)
MKTIRRLVVSLDGTWNNRDDSTNVLYSHSLAFECSEKEWKGNRVTQQRYYQEGVGTGPLDRLTGGGFGLGLENHVREAYDWLVQNYEDGSGLDNPPDEIYVFGFSRGAYTARSLVGFISTCGLLRRGAPLTVNQLWENSCILGLEREERNGGVARKFFGEPAAKFRRITDLLWDPWFVHASKNVPDGEVPGQRPNLTLTSTEELLVRWSRRVKITYLGVYDTVGAVGWDALAIPGLRSKLAVQHNMRPTTIIQKCRHALAIDEHRSSFGHTPFVAYIGGKTASGELERNAGNQAEGASEDGFKIRGENWERVAQMWKDKIEQRWFVGAHSNIGGGYPDNRLAQRPLEWMLEGARNAGLICEKIPPAPANTPAQVKPRDSFAEFVSPLWTTVFRAKRHYRVIDPIPELRANRNEKKTKGSPRAGFSLVTINEQVDETVLDYWATDPAAPANLVEYAARQKAVQGNSVPEKLAALIPRPSANRWPGQGFFPQFALVIWATLAAGGLAVTDRLFQVWPPSPPWWLLAVIAGLFPLVDWLESHTNSVVATSGVTPGRRALLDSIYWLRSLGVVLFVFGLFGTVCFFWDMGWQAASFAEAGALVVSLVRDGGWVPLSAIAGAFLANGFNRTLKPGFGKKLGGWLTGGATVLALMALTIFVARALGHVVLAAFDGVTMPEAIPPVPDAIRVAGLLLMLQLAFAYFIEAFSWVGEPMGKANLGGIVALQLKASPKGVHAQLVRWCKMLGEHHDVSKKECGMTCIVRQALWRDVFGFIPVYSVVILFGWWFGAEQLHWKDWHPAFGILWWILPVTVAVADYAENLCHFRYLSLHDDGRMPGRVLTVFSFLMTLVKFAGFFIGILGVAGALLCASGHIAWDPHRYGWRGLIALLVSVGTLLVLVGFTVWGWIYRLLNYWEKERAHASKA